MSQSFDEISDQLSAALRETEAKPDTRPSMPPGPAGAEAGDLANAGAARGEDAEQGFTADELLDLALGKIEDELESIRKERRVLMERHKREMDRVEHRLIRAQKTRERIWAKIPG